MPIEHINKTDTLNQGREKLNAAIDGANAADVTSKAADTKATQALANSESTQTQLDTIVIDGDSSVEAAQARVDEKGVPHSTLKARIDDGMNSVNQQLAQRASLLDMNVTATVGEGGDYSTINEAIEELSKYKVVYTEQGYLVKILLLSGFVMQEQVLADGIDLGWVIIEAEDEEVVAVRSALTNSIGSRYPLFGANNNAIGVRLNATFIMDDSGASEGRDGYLVRQNSSGIIMSGGVQNAGEHGLHCAYVGSIEGRVCDFSGASGTGIIARFNSRINLRDGTGERIVPKANNCGRGVFSEHGSVIHVRDMEAKNAETFALHAKSGGRIYSRTSELDGAGTTAVLADSSSEIHVIGGIKATNPGYSSLEAREGSKIVLDGGTRPDLRGNYFCAIIADGSSEVYAPRSNMSGVTRGVRCFNGSRINTSEALANDIKGVVFDIDDSSELIADNVEAKNATGRVLDILSSRASLKNSDLSGSAGQNTIQASGGSSVILNGSNCQKGSAPESGFTTADIRTHQGSSIAAFNTIGGLSQTKNEVTEHGVIYRN